MGISQMPQGPTTPLGTPSANPQQSKLYSPQSSNSPTESECCMSAKGIEEVSAQVPAEDFQALEERVYRTIELYKAAKQARANAERDTQRLREQLEQREEENQSLRRELVQLRKDREDIRGRVEKMLNQMESLGQEQAAS
jgi:septal ring factor EnvC (AmiA/AmiB activator)